MTLWISYVKAWLKEQTGQDLAEYALLIGLIALAVVAAVGVLGSGIDDVMSDIAAEIGSWVE